MSAAGSGRRPTFIYGDAGRQSRARAGVSGLFVAHLRWCGFEAICDCQKPEAPHTDVSSRCSGCFHGELFTLVHAGIQRPSYQSIGALGQKHLHITCRQVSETVRSAFLGGGKPVPHRSASKRQQRGQSMLQCGRVEACWRKLGRAAGFLQVNGDSLVHSKPIDTAGRT